MEYVIRKAFRVDVFWVDGGEWGVGVRGVGICDFEDAARSETGADDDDCGIESEVAGVDFRGGD